MELNIPSIKELKEETTPEMVGGLIMIIGIGIVFGLLMFSFIFPTGPCETKQCPAQGSTNMTIDGVGLQLAKTWNSFNSGTQEFQIDSCNKATRVPDGGANVTWQITLKGC